MVSLIIGSVPIHGHVLPLLTLARHLVARGDDVRFVTGSRFADAVSSTGAEFVPLPPDADFDDRKLTTLFPELAHVAPMHGVGFYVEHVFTRPAIPQYYAIESMLRAEPADAIIMEPTFGAGAVLSILPPSARPPLVVAGLNPLSIPSRNLAPFGFGVTPMSGSAGRIRNAALRALSERVILRGARRASDEVARKTVGIAAGGSSVSWVGRVDAVAQFTVASFEYPRPDLTTRLTFTGPIATSATETSPLPQWWADLDGSRPVVLVARDALDDADFSELALPTVTALADEPVLVVVVTGGASAAALGRMPANVRLAETTPVADLLPRTDVYITNGGYEGTQSALRYGVPIVAVPGTEDENEVAARVEWSGVGVRLGPRRPTPKQLRAAVRGVIAGSGYRVRTEALAAEIAGSSGVAGVAGVIDDAIACHPGRTGALPTHRSTALVA